MTAVAGRRMAETVARRGGLAVLPQDIPLEVVAEVVAWVKERAPGPRHPAHARARTTPSATRCPCCPSGRTARSWSSTDGRPVGIVTEARLRRASTGSPSCRGDDHRPARARRRRRPARGVRRARRRAAAGSPRSSTRDGRLVGVLTRTGALRSTIYRPALDAARPAAGRGRGRHQRRRRRPRPTSCSSAGVDMLVVDTAHGHQERMLEALRGRCAPLDPARAGRRRQRRRPPRASATWSRPAPTSSRSASGRARCARPG